jgi:hypothetical protein
VGSRSWLTFFEAIEVVESQPETVTLPSMLLDGSDLTWDDDEVGPIRLRAEDLAIGG